MTAEHLASTFLQQAVACGRLGSPMYKQILTATAEDIRAGEVPALLCGHEDDPGPSALALRMLGGLHALVLAGAAPELDRFYPSAGGVWAADTGWPAVRAALDEHAEALRPLLGQAPQTNEVGRSAALLGGLLHLVDDVRLPVRLWEIGSSAGLNLRADRYRYRFDGGEWGPRDSPLVLDSAWAGPPPPVDAPLTVVERYGSDLSPLDPTTRAGRLRASSYVWPDQTERWARFQAALRVAEDAPALVVRSDAVQAVAAIDLLEEHVTVLWHSVMWQYLDQAAQRTIAASIDALGERASRSAPFAHLFMEPSRRGRGHPHEFLVVLRSWPGGDRRILGVAAAHGLPTTWGDR